MMTIRGRRLLPLFGFSTACLFTSALWAAPETGEVAESSSETAVEAATDADSRGDATVTLGSVTIGIDPKTGELRPLSAAEQAKLAREMSRLFKPRKLERIENPDGSLSAVVAPNVLEYAMVKIESDGSVSRSYVQGPDEVERFLLEESPATAPKPRE